MKKLNPDVIRLSDIMQAINDIESHAINDLKSRKTLHAVLYNIALIGEAAGKLSNELKQNHSNIPWAAIINMRNRIVHDYGNINIRIIEEVIKDDLSVLGSQIRAIIDRLES